jgi:SAM-dependent methyltransferase
MTYADRMHHEAIVDEFTRQARTFGRSAVAHSAPPLEGLLALAQPGRGERWLDAACGPGIVTRAMAPLVGEILGVDVTPAMVAQARREADALGIANVTFALGDATALELPSASRDGALARFAIHHIPVPGRLFDELARVVRPGGKVVLGDHLADADAGAAAWATEIERLRDPSHWAALPRTRLRALGRAAGLRLEAERVVALSLAFEDWLQRGSGGPGAAALIARALAERPRGSECFRVREDGARRLLELRLWLSRWRR